MSLLQRVNDAKGEAQRKEHIGMQLFVSNLEYANFCNGQKVYAFRDCPGDVSEHKRINVAGDEIMEDFGHALLIEKHY